MLPVSAQEGANSMSAIRSPRPGSSTLRSYDAKMLGLRHRRTSVSIVTRAIAFCTAVGLSAWSLPALARVDMNAGVSAELVLQDGPSEEDVERAKNLYLEAEDLALAGKHMEALPLYEEAYNLVPGKHGFAYKVGVSAYKVGDCIKAKQFFEHLVTYGAEEDKLADKVAEGRKILAEIEKSGCAEKQQEEINASLAAEENPFEMAAAQPAAEGPDADKPKKERKKRSGLKIGGYALTGLGGLSLVAGGVTMVLARKNANELAGLAEPGTSGFGTGDYACRVDGDPCPYTLEVNMKRLNVTSWIAFGAGTVALAAGVYLLVLDKKKSGASKVASQRTRYFVAPTLLQSGAGASAVVRF